MFIAYKVFVFYNNMVRSSTPRIKLYDSLYNNEDCGYLNSFASTYYLYI